jgi:hypothetical protein
LQRGSYFAIDTKHLRLVCIDTGIDGRVDADQAEWLIATSSGDARPKVLLTGKPLLVDFEYRPGPLEGDHGPFGTVDDVVRHPPHNFIAAIGGDIHNFQHYRGTGRRRIDYVVSGGGGAYMSATHPVGTRLVAGGHTTEAAAEEVARTIVEEEFFPDRIQSLCHFSGLLLPRVRRLTFALAAAVAGMGAAAIVVWRARDAAGTVRDVSAIVLAAALVVRAVLPSKAARTPGYRALLPPVAFTAGLAGALAGWWLAPGRFEEHSGGWAALVVAGVAVALGLRWTGWWRTDGAARRLGAGAILVTVVLGGAAGAITWLAADDAWTAAAVGAAVVAAGAGWVLRSQQRWSAGRAFRLATSVQAVLVLVVVWRLIAPQSARDEVGWAVLAAPALIALTVVVAIALAVVTAFATGTVAEWLGTSRRLALGRVGGVVQALLAPSAAAAVVGAGLALDQAALPDDRWRALLAPLMTPLTVVGVLFGLDWLRRTTPRWVRWFDLVPATAVVVTLALWNTLDLATCLIVAVSAVVVVVARRVSTSRAYKVDATVYVVLAVIALAHYDVEDTWALSAAVAATVILGTALLGLAVVHLTFLGAFGLWRAGGSLPLNRTEAAQVVRWRQEGDAHRPSDAGVRRRANVVFPGEARPHGPLQDAVSEVFDSDEAPFYKHFLELRVVDGLLHVHRHDVTGRPPGPGQVREPYSFSIPLAS